MGFAGSVQPSFVIPTAVAGSDNKLGRRNADLEDLEIAIGYDAINMASTQQVTYPVKHGLVEDWDSMEKFWNGCIYQHLRCAPEEHRFVLTEPPLNPPANREFAAEVMFETFNVEGLFIGVQAVLSLYASFAMAEQKQQARGHSLTGTVLDSGDGVTHVIPVVDNYVLAGSIKSMPIAGRDITSFVQTSLRERSEPVPPDMSFEVARAMKESYGYVCSDVGKEYLKHDELPSKYIKQHLITHPRTGQQSTASTGYERFLGPEIFFNPSIVSNAFTTPLPQVVDDVIQSCPIDTRRSLYGNVVLSGGSTCFKGMERRLQRDLTQITSARMKTGSTAIDVQVVSHPLQRFAAWFGGSLLASSPDFPKMCHSRAEYLEHGPSICRKNFIFNDA